MVLYMISAPGAPSDEIIGERGCYVFYTTCPRQCTNRVRDQHEYANPPHPHAAGRSTPFTESLHRHSQAREKKYAGILIPHHTLMGFDWFYPVRQCAVCLRNALKRFSIRVAHGWVFGRNHRRCSRKASTLNRRAPAFGVGHGDEARNLLVRQSNRLLGYRLLLLFEYVSAKWVRIERHHLHIQTSIHLVICAKIFISRRPL